MKAVIDALQALRGVAKITAITLATELGTFARFTCAPQVMSYTGLVPSEHSSGARDRRGAITKAGNAHLRRVLVEAAWHYRHRPSWRAPEAASGSLTPQVAAIAWKAQATAPTIFATDQRSKPAGKIVTAIARGSSDSSGPSASGRKKKALRLTGARTVNGSVSGRAGNARRSSNSLCGSDPRECQRQLPTDHEHEATQSTLGYPA
jgi:hypothetical protein